MRSTTSQPRNAEADTEAAADSKISTRLIPEDQVRRCLLKATLGAMKISEVPITLHKDGRSRPPHLRPWRDGLRHLRLLVFLRFFYHSGFGNGNSSEMS